MSFAMHNPNPQRVSHTPYREEPIPELMVANLPPPNIVKLAKPNQDVVKADRGLPGPAR